MAQTLARPPRRRATAPIISRASCNFDSPGAVGGRELSDASIEGSNVVVAIAILAAGRGTRMKSSLPKVLHSLGGKPMVERVLDSCRLIEPQREIVVIGYEGDRIRQALAHRPAVEFAEQPEQLGTGHAVQQVMPLLEGYRGSFFVLNGDVPLLRPETLAQLLQTHQAYHSDATILTAIFEDPKGYGRVFCDEANRVERIVEDRDCTPEQARNCRINAGVYCFDWAALAEILPGLSNDNAQREYYITDVFARLPTVMAVDVEDVLEIGGINNRQQLAAAYETLQERVKKYWLLSGVTMIDAKSITIDETVTLAPDVTIEPQTHLRGDTVVAAGCHLGPGSLIENSTLAEGVTVRYSVVSDSQVDAGARIGPYAHLRGQARVGKACRVGNFVEIKNSSLGHNTNVAHLAYLGDAILGQEVNIGAGTITANYDGCQKHPTTIGDRSKTGSNSVLVAPISLGCDVTVAAGSTVTEDIPDDALVIARSRQVVRPGWRPKTEPGASAGET